ncbi:MAG: hypothetical protein M9914_14270 [Trueperaceae bacterium]|nr:hypothetical protein [Trueperaceae bacterium]
MTVPMTIAVRPGDVALRDALNVALAARWADVRRPSSSATTCRSSR